MAMSDSSNLDIRTPLVAHRMIMDDLDLADGEIAALREVEWLRKDNAQLQARIEYLELEVSQR